MKLLLRIVLGLLLFTPLTAAQERREPAASERPVCERPPRAKTAEGTPPSPEQLAEARRRWEALTPEQRAQLADRYQRFQSLGDEARRELRERAANLELLEERLCRRFTDEERDRLERLAPPQRSEVLREMVRSELESQGQRVLLHLPEELRRRLADASDEDRLRYFQRYKLAIRERLSSSAIRVLGEELALPREEVQRLLELAGPERIEAALELGKRLGRREVEQGGLPQGLTLERWRQIEALPPEEFYQEIVRLSDGLRPAPPESDGHEIAHELRRALRPSREAILEHAELPREERVRAIRTNQRPRLTELLRKSGLLDAQQMVQLEALPDGAFYAQVRRIANERGGPPSAGDGPDSGKRRPDGRRAPDGAPGREGKPRRDRPGGTRPAPPPKQPPPTPHPPRHQRNPRRR